MPRLSLAALCLAAMPVAATAQSFQLSPPSIGDALRQMDRMHQAGDRRGLAEPRSDLAQTFVLPERPGQNQVAWYEFAWHHHDVPSPNGGQGGVRLYYYAREREVAERALPVIRNAYLRLVDEFHYTPTKQIPYILYASQREFQATNVFQVGESVLGVTSPRDLKMSLPYFGNHELFREVSTHELVHQFTIQKLLDVAGAEDVASPIEALPLWFIEGIAEYYAKGGIDAETDLFLRDLMWNPDAERHYEVISFQEDRYRGYIPTYKLGQARIAFIAETYGKEKIQDYLENALLIGGGGTHPGEKGFAALTRRVLNEPLQEVDTRWRAWLKRRYFPGYAALRQDLAQLRELLDLPAEPEAMQASPDGQVLFVRGIDREAGRVKLFLLDARHPRGAVEVASDNRPGVESLHPLEHLVMAVSERHIAYSAQAGASDVLYVQPYRHTPPKGGRPPRLELGERRTLELRHPTGRHFIEISDPTFSPDGSQLAFTGMTDAGQLDIYLVASGGGPVRQLTDDPYAERELHWGTAGLYYASDATDHGRFNLFRIDPASGARTRLTTGNWDDHSPRSQADGSVLFSSLATGKPDLYVLQNGKTRRLTDFATGLTTPAAAPQGRGLWASTFYRGRFRLVEVPRVAWVEEPALPVPAPLGPVLGIPRDDFPAQVPGYDPVSLGNWRPEAAMIMGAGAGSAVAGQAALLFSDLLRDRILYLNLAVLGSFEYTQFLALYENRSQRMAHVLGAFHFVQEQVDLVNPNLAFLQRDFGAIGSLRYPIDRFRRVEAELSVGAVQRYCLTNFTTTFISCGAVDPSLPGAADFRQRNGGTQPQLGPTLRYGYDTVRYDPLAGPIAGEALLLELGGQWLPWRHALSGFVRADATKYLQISGRAKLFLRVAGGSSFAPDEEGKNWSRTWWITAADNLRGYFWNDLAYLIGRNYYVANLEMQLPLDPILRLAIFDSLFAVAALDFGGVFNHFSTRAGCDAHRDVCSDGFLPTPNDLGAWDVRTLTGVLGVNMLFGPLLLRVHFGHPFDIGGIHTPAQRDGSSWVTNVTLRYFFF